MIIEVDGVTLPTIYTEIQRLQHMEEELKYAILVFSVTADRDGFIDRVHEIAKQ